MAESFLVLFPTQYNGTKCIMERILKCLSNSSIKRRNGNWKTGHRHPLKDDLYKASKFLFLNSPGFSDYAFLQLVYNPGYINVVIHHKKEDYRYNRPL